ncbi:MAG: ethylbenzene dehydrogenase-related protein, partial [Planctomycetaceae bacterium]
DGPTRSALLLTGNHILARHVLKVPQSPADNVWSGQRPVRIRLMPLWWRDDHVETVEIRAVHDGKTLALHLSWQDAVMDARAVRTEEFSDAAAVQFSADDQPPFLGMGSRQSQVSVWYWRADHAADTILAGIDTAFPDMIVNFYPFQKPALTGVPGRGGTIDQQDPRFIAGVGSNNPVSELRPPHSIQNLAATGFGTLTPGHRPRTRIDGQSEWNSGRWQLMLSRDLKVISAHEIPLEPGHLVSVSFAIWEGSARDRGPRKQVSIWQTLRLEKP